MNYRLLAIDIDGTLVNSRDELTPATRAAIARATAAGIHVVLATGRRYRRALQSGRVARARACRWSPPAEPWSRTRPRTRPSTAPSSIRRPSGCCWSRWPSRAASRSSTATRTPRASISITPATAPAVRNSAEYLDRNTGLGRLWADWPENPPPTLYAGFVIGGLEEMLRLETLIQRRVPGALSTHVLRSPRYSGYLCEFSPAGATKWSAIRRLADAWGIADEAICAVGDDVNDIPMIRAAGLGVAMGNALPPVKAVADRIAPTHDADGLARSRRVAAGW